LTAIPPPTGVIDADVKGITAATSPPAVVEWAFIGELRTVKVD
jgi:hypothetical protein